jgi:hypothetical protein
MIVATYPADNESGDASIGALISCHGANALTARRHMIRRERLTAVMNGEFVVFLIGIRINSFFKVHKWLQYWRSIDQLLAYASSKSEQHLPAWRKFNQSVGTDGSVGIWHETYLVSPGAHESMYVNMRPFGLGKAGMLVQASGQRHRAEGRLKAGTMRSHSMTYGIQGEPNGKT